MLNFSVSFFNFCLFLSRHYFFKCVQNSVQPSSLPIDSIVELPFTSPISVFRLQCSLLPSTFYSQQAKKKKMKNVQIIKRNVQYTLWNVNVGLSMFQRLLLLFFVIFSLSCIFYIFSLHCYWQVSTTKPIKKSILNFINRLWVNDEINISKRWKKKL